MKHIYKDVSIYEKIWTIYGVLVILIVAIACLTCRSASGDPEWIEIEAKTNLQEDGSLIYTLDKDDKEVAIDSTGSGELVDFVGVTLEPTYSFVFYLGDELVGTLSWKDGTFTFDGDVEKSAQAFFDYLAMYDVVVKRRDQ